MKNFILKIKQALRWRILTLLGRAKDDNDQFNTLIKHFILSAPLILDVGAHKGESIKRFKALFPNALIHSFEPDEISFKALSDNYAHLPNTFINNVGVSSKKGSLTFHRNLKSSTSGFHPVDSNSAWAKNRSKRHGVSAEDFTSKSYDVPVIMLDDYIEEHNIPHIHLLKIDTQGHEDEVLAGAIKTLEKGIIDIIETELIVGAAYTKSLQFHDLEKLLIPLGYRFYAVDKGGDLLSTPSLSFNLLYVHKRLLSD